MAQNSNRYIEKHIILAGRVKGDDELEQQSGKSEGKYGVMEYGKNCNIVGVSI